MIFSFLALLPLSIFTGVVCLRNWSLGCLSEDLNNIFNNIIKIIIFTKIKHLPFRTEIVLNEFLLFNVAVSFTQRLYLLQNVCHTNNI